MSDLNDLQALGEELVPIFKRLFALPDLLADEDDTSAEAAVITRLRKVTAEANQPTRGDLLSRADAVISSRDALTEIIIQADARTDAIEETRLRIVEAHLLDFEGDIYGETLEVHFLRRHRDEQRFASQSELVAQIDRDVKAFREWRQ